MKTKEIAKSYGLDPSTFDVWLKQSGRQHKSGMTGLIIGDNVDVTELVDAYNCFLAQKEARRAKERARIEAEEAKATRAAEAKQQVLASMLITSGFSFDGHTITKYSGYISGDDAVQMDRPRGGWLGVRGDVGADLLRV